MKQISGGVTAAKGFCAASTAAGIKYKDRKDMALIFSKTPCKAAGTFTTNIVKAAPVKWDQKIVAESACAHAVVVNAGIANACTGQEGMDYCSQTADHAAELLKIPADSVLVASTGVIGMQLPIDRIKAGISELAKVKKAGIESGTEAAKAIMTTDTKKKEVAVQFQIGDKTVTIGGMAKGSGMIHPNMCTMLGFVTTDAAITKELLQKALSDDVKDTYNMVSVDGDTSTNDMCIVMANGMAQNEVFEKEVFDQVLHFVMEELAKKIAADGEGAGKLMTVTVNGVDTLENAQTLAMSVCSSSLVKAAMFGADANWGRVICALGYSGVEFDPELVDISFKSNDEILCCESGKGLDFDEEKAKSILLQEEIEIICDMHSGNESCTCWGCDLTYDYVKINGDYRT